MSTTTPPINTAVVSASVRDGRLSTSIAAWVADAAGRQPGLAVDLIDLAAIELPDDSLLYPGGGTTRSDTADRVEASEAFVFVTPEYNHSYPASLKRFIDWHYQEWKFKPAAIVSYGVQGGHAAAEHLRGVLAELSVVGTRRALGLRQPWNSLDDEERFVPDPHTTGALTSTLEELTWWAGVLSNARAGRPFAD